MPFFARWPGRIAASATCDALICHTDLMATCAELIGETLPDDAGEDSVSLLRLLLDPAADPPRQEVIHHSIQGCFSIRQDRWKLECCPGSGGWTSPKDEEARAAGMPAVQLYDMAADVGETANLAGERPDIVTVLRARLEERIAAGRSTPGAPQANDVPVELLK